MFQFSLGGYFRFFSRKSIGSNFRDCLHAYKYSQKFYMLACILTKWVSLFSRVVIFAGNNFRFFSKRENYNSAKINVLKVYNFIYKMCSGRYEDVHVLRHNLGTRAAMKLSYGILNCP